MRLDPKYFNLFIAVCALLAFLAIIYSTIRYSQKQVLDFEENIAAVQLDTLAFKSFAVSDSLFLKDKVEEPVVIQFWSTWSGKSLAVNEFLDEFSMANSELFVIAAAVRDGEEQILEYINSHPYDFSYVDGTKFFQSVYAPGIPSQILIDRRGELFETQIGDDIDALREKLTRLLEDE
jgi:thiol-disulfide isomerase/thioredoxin